MRFYFLFFLVWCISGLYGQDKQLIHNDSLTIDLDLFTKEDTIQEKPVKTMMWIEPRQTEAYFKCCENEDYDEQKTCSDKELLVQVLANIIYPEIARENGFQGRVYVEFEILETGEIGEVSILKGVHSSIDSEVVKGVKKLTGYEPATLWGNPIKSRLVVPVYFRIR